MPNYRQRFVNMFLGLHLGDAFGVPFEAMTRGEILAATGGGVTGPMFDLAIERKVKDTRGLPKGGTSDDSQLANAVAEGLILAGGYDHELQVLLHLHALWNDTAGWGGTTKRSLYEIDKHYRAQRIGVAKPPDFKQSMANAELWAKATARDPEEPARVAPRSRGNGVAMKIAPLGVFLGWRRGFDGSDGFRTIFRLGRITHADPICSVAAHALAGVVGDLLHFGPEGVFLRLKPRIAQAERMTHELHQDGTRFSNALQTALRLSGEPEKLWAFGSEGMSDALTTVALALAIWYRRCEDRDPTAAVLEAINAGGDTDTVASMVGAMMGAASDDPEWWPKSWVSALHDGGSLAHSLGADLYGAADGRKPLGWNRDERLRALGYA